MSQYNTGNPVPSSDMRDAWDNNSTLDNFLSNNELTVTTRTGIERDSLAGIQKKAEDQREQIAVEGAAVVESTRQNLIPLSRQYMTLADAQADIANIPDGSATYVRSGSDSSLADEYMNNGGVLSATGKSMPSKFLADLIERQVLDVLYRVSGIFQGVDFPFEVTSEDGQQAIAVDQYARLLANNGVNIPQGGVTIGGFTVINLPEDSEYACALGDGAGRVAIGIGKDAFVEILGMRFYLTEGDNLIEITDSQLRVSSGIDKNGRTFSNDPLGGSGTPDSRYIEFAERLHVLIYGQSLSLGQYGTPALGTPAAEGLMYDTGVRSYNVTPSSIVGLNETVNGTYGETIASSLVHGFASNSGGMYGRKIILNSAGIGGVAIETLSKGQPAYTQLVNNVAWTAGKMESEGREYSADFICWMQGEANMANGTSYASYQASLAQLQSDLNSDTASQRSSGANLIMLTYQTSSHGFYVGTVTNPPEMIAQAQLDLALTNEFIDMWGPTYMGMPADHIIGQGNVHHNNHGYRLQGLYAQKALRHRLQTRTVEKPDGEKYLPVHAKSAKKINSRTVLVEMHTYHPPLVIDASYVSELSDGQHGVELHDSTGRLSVVNVEIVGGTKIRITAATDIASDSWVAFAWTPENRGEITNNRYQQWFFGRETGVRTTIHDSDPEVTDLTDETGKPYPLYNYPAIQKIAISQ